MRFNICELLNGYMYVVDRCAPGGAKVVGVEGTYLKAQALVAILENCSA